MNRVVSRLGFTTLALVAGVVAHAQSSTTGSITGVVKDKSGAPVAGATITAVSLQTTRTVVTGADGSYRLGLLNPGEWQIKVSKAGMQANTQKMTVYTNQNNVSNFTLDKEASAEVVVIGVQNNVDFTSTQQGKVLSTETFDALPKGRDFAGLALLTPGVVSGGMPGRPDPSMGGASAAENQYVLDGLETTDFRRGYQGAQVVTDFIEQVEVQTGGFRPEFSALGGVFNAVTKSGSNDFKGSAWATWDARGIHAKPKQNAVAQETNPVSRYDIGAEVSGPIIKDKLFYFAGIDLNRVEAPGEVNLYPGLKATDRQDDNLQFLGKMNWFITQDHQLSVTVNAVDFKQDRANIYALRGDRNFGGTTKASTLNSSINWDWNISSALSLSVKAGQTHLKNTFDATDPNTPAFTDNFYFRGGPGAGAGLLGTNFNFSHGGAGTYDANDENKSTQFKADLSWFIGSHSLKFGVSRLDTEYINKQVTSGGYSLVFINLGAANNVDADVSELQQNFNDRNASVKATMMGFYAQDQWEVFGGFRLMYGFRFETQDQKDKDGKSFMKFDNFSDLVQPRVGFTWDLDNDGKTKVSASYARYFERIPQRLAIRVFSNERFLQYIYDGAGVGGTLPAGAYDNATGTITFNQSATVNDGVVDNATPFSYDPIAKGTKLPERKEFTLGVDHTFASGWTAGVHTKFRELTHPIEDSVILRPWYNLGRTAAGVTTTGTGVATAAQLASIAAGMGFNPYTASGRISGTATNGVFSSGNFDVNFRNPYDAGAPFAPGAVFTGWGVPAALTNFGGQAILWNPGRNAAWTSRSISGTPNTDFVVGGTGFDEAKNTYQSVDITLEKKTERSYFSFAYTWSKLYGNYEGLVSSSNGQEDGNITASFDYDPYVGFGLLPLDRTNTIKVQASHRYDFLGNSFNVGMTWDYRSGIPGSVFDDGTLTAQFRGEPITNRGTTNSASATFLGLNGNNGRGNLKYDPGFYGRNTPVNGQLGQFNRLPNLSEVALHLDYDMKFGGIRVIPSADVFNVFNSRTAATTGNQATTSSGAANVTFNQELSWLEGRRYRFGVKVRF